jgi:uncharacterized protein
MSLQSRRLALASALLAAAAAAPATAQSQTVTVSAPDGTPLATDLYLPLFSGHGPWPVVLMRTPYGRDGLRAECFLFVLQGYACVAQDTRGRGGSGGVDTVFRDDGPDGRATLAWIAGREWCNGRIATFGASAFGLTEYALAPGAAPQLVTMGVAVATPDFYHHAAFQGGALRDALVVHWLEGQGSGFFIDELKAHRRWDDWWEETAVAPHLGDVTASVLHIGGWYDIFQQGTLDAFTLLQHGGGPGARGHQVLVMGPWTHGTLGGNAPGQLTYPANATRDLVTLLLDWYAFWLDGRANGVDAWAPVQVYLMGAAGEPQAPGNRWVELPDWPPASVASPRYLGGDGRLTIAPPLPGEVALAADPASPVPTLGGDELYPELPVEGRAMGAGPYDQRPLESRGDVLAFTSEPLRTPLTVIGRLTASIWVLPDTTDLDIAVRLTDVYPDGRSMLVADGLQRARMRCGDDRECFLVPGQPAELAVDLWSTAIVFAAGHRIRVDVAGSNAPRFEVNRNDGGDLDAAGANVVAHPAILVGGAHPSRLVLPEMQRAPHLMLRGAR